MTRDRYPAEYRECITSYASVTAGGQAVSGGSGNFLDVLLQGLSGGTQTTSTPTSSATGGWHLCCSLCYRAAT